MNNKAALVGGLGLGAAIMYFFDPDRGSRRRALVRDKCESAANKTGDYAGKLSRDLRNRAYGVVAETKARLRHEEVTDDLLVERVRSKLGRLHNVASEITANDGVVTLRGPIVAEKMPQILRAVKYVRGVKGIDNQLEIQSEPESASPTQDTPAPFGAQPEAAGGI